MFVYKIEKVEKKIEKVEKKVEKWKLRSRKRGKESRKSGKEITQDCRKHCEESIVENIVESNVESNVGKYCEEIPVSANISSANISSAKTLFGISSNVLQIPIYPTYVFFLLCEKTENSSSWKLRSCSPKLKITVTKNSGAVPASGLRRRLCVRLTPHGRLC